jgi:hypothetical protein
MTNVPTSGAACSAKKTVFLVTTMKNQSCMDSAPHRQLPDGTPVSYQQGGVLFLQRY